MNEVFNLIYYHKGVRVDRGIFKSIEKAEHFLKSLIGNFRTPVVRGHYLELQGRYFDYGNGYMIVKREVK